MILREIRIKGFRSFCEEESLIIESDVTILTGPNDVGKTAVLDLIRMMCDSEKGNEEDANFDNLREASEQLDTSQEFSIHATFFVPEVDSYFDVNLTSYYYPRNNWEVDIRYRPNLKQLDVTRIKVDDDTILNVQDLQGREMLLKRLPTAIDLTKGETIRSQVSQSDINGSEDHMFTLAFGPDYQEKLLGYSEDVFRSQCRRGVESLNSRLEKVLPGALGLNFAIVVTRQDQLEFVIGITDAVSGDTPVRLRGSGAQKLLRLMVDLLSIDPETEYAIVLLDEPENSLHADAQHALRYRLEKLATQPKIQVIYATHSSCMINPSRARSLRLLSREVSPNGNPTTRVNNEPYEGGGYQLVRTSLGMSPADSLLYGAITVVVEGDTEELALARILEMIIIAFGDVPYPELDVETVLGQIRIVGAGRL